MCTHVFLCVPTFQGLIKPRGMEQIDPSNKDKFAEHCFIALSMGACLSGLLNLCVGHWVFDEGLHEYLHGSVLPYACSLSIPL